tara:strand:+ start:44 stop:349 length:306 start_codon:yes stop_codon:yes gene_type:complete
LINCTKNATSDNEVVLVKEWLRDSTARLFRNYVMNEIAFHQAMAGREASLNGTTDRDWEVNDHIKTASKLVSFINLFDEYSKPEKELYKLTLNIDTTLLNG